ncbi:zinc-finger domain-containing protein [uncultured Cocleimonas sp.]|uniref:zinc-finger domain-containing protein n=1 Tax=uncultured Cocleimonas sp. TaxID=1051587 RepID=UPI00261BFD8C|nr:zinc-finger domain-containing protein [uncultured Cocleimonas sp.]
MASQGSSDKEADYKKLNITNDVTITRNELPLHCPTNVSALWCAHPKVYLAIENSKDGTARCPYCGTLYHLQD